MSAILDLLGVERRTLWPHTLWSRAMDATPATGKIVTPSTSITSTAVWACVRVLSESIATLPLHIYKRTVTGRERDDTHPLYVLLHDRPNERQTAVEWREQAMMALLLWGNAYAWLERWPSGRVKAIWPLRPDRIVVRTDTVTDDSPVPGLVYVYRAPSGAETVYPASEILHIRGLSSDGLVGLSPITIHREAVAVEQAEREFAGRFFGNNARPGGVLKVPGKLSPDAASRLKSSWEAAHRGVDNSHRVAVLEEGIEWQALSMPLSDAQFIEQRRFSLEEIARIYRVPLHMVGELSHATFSNIEHQGIEFVTQSVRPWCVRIEQAYNANLFYPVERQNYYTEHSMDALLRGDIQARYSAYAVGRQWGWLSINDIRGKENLNPIPEGGDVYLQPLNYTDVANPTVATNQQAQPASTAAIVREIAPRQLPALPPEVVESPSFDEMFDLERRFTAPEWLRDNARRGLAWYEEGKAGEGVTAQTVREARAMAGGFVSESKARRMAAWFARHMVDLDAPAANPDSPDYPSPGVVAHALWGGGTRDQSTRAQRWAERAVKSLSRDVSPLPADMSGDVEAIARGVIRGLDLTALVANVRDAIGDDDDGATTTD